MSHEEMRGEKINVYTGIIERIQAMIAKGELAVGDKLPAERRLAERFAVSRSHLRQALQALAERGVIESRQGDGTYLLSTMEQGAQVDAIFDAIAARRDVLHEIIEFRQIIEPPIAALAASRINKDDLDQLKVVACDQGRALLGGREATDLDARFHQILAESTGNRTLGRVMETLQSILDESRSAWLQSATRRSTSVEGHLKIIDALEAGDSQMAGQAMQRHLEAVEQVLFPTDTKKRKN
ncbi:FadR family transcriptional regulator [Desulfobulbus rhabdoformis]|jgi:GntR family transcriptional repressor for pyruvate dehydrogenase complex|uniref:FadR/GntR family transcriptional regulator n=1 Tax=Desulfobulbus rhabdoformis TaxID=34032 RepID=UPI001965893A|nr:FadR/GntR family transcriptional regulator [Desulfobulbus rhabdoformis]MBM9613935.1 FadR family transcriptional regulator [Desulfobulbus rhabdoformis]